LKRGIVCDLQQRDAGIILLRAAPGKGERGFFYSLNARVKRRAAGVLAKHDDASRRVRLSALLGALLARLPGQDCAKRR